VDPVDDARRWLADAARVVVLTGAGISTDSGIPDFRGPEGRWTKDPAAEKAAQISNYLEDPEVRVRAWRARADPPTVEVQPNAGHRALVDLERTGRLHTLITQNIDGLHVAAGSDPTKWRLSCQSICPRAMRIWIMPSINEPTIFSSGW
jgi:NAD-dependent deacetylase